MIEQSIRVSMGLPELFIIALVAGVVGFAVGALIGYGVKR